MAQKREHQGNSTHLIHFQQLHIHEGHTALNKALLLLQASVPEFAVKMLPLLLGAGISRRYHGMRRKTQSEDRAVERMWASNVIFGNWWAGRRWARPTRAPSHLLVLHPSVSCYKYTQKKMFSDPLELGGGNAAHFGIWNKLIILCFAIYNRNHSQLFQ